jgi:hypothetical protein
MRRLRRLRSGGRRASPRGSYARRPAPVTTKKAKKNKQVITVTTHSRVLSAWASDFIDSSGRIAQLVFASIVLLVLLFLTGPLQYLPRCVLAGIVFTIAVGMIDVKGLRDIRRESPSEFYLAVGTAAAVVAIGVEQGILLAIALSLLMHVRSPEPYRFDASMCRRSSAALVRLAALFVAHSLSDIPVKSTVPLKCVWSSRSDAALADEIQ